MGEASHDSHDFLRPMTAIARCPFRAALRDGQSLEIFGEANTSNPHCRMKNQVFYKLFSS